MSVDKGKFTIGERRGMIALLLVVAITIATIVLCNRTDTIPPQQGSIDSATQELVRQDIGSDSAQVKRKKKQKKRKQDKPTKQPAPPRDILSEEVPQINN